MTFPWQTTISWVSSCAAGGEADFAAAFFTAFGAVTFSSSAAFFVLFVSLFFSSFAFGIDSFSLSFDALCFFAFGRWKSQRNPASIRSPSFHYSASVGPP